MAKKQTKRAWVLALASTVPAARAVELGKRAGVRLTTAQVHTIRSVERRAVKGGGGRTLAARRLPGNGASVDGARSGNPSGAPATSVDREHAFAELALDVGLARTAELLSRVRRAAAELRA